MGKRLHIANITLSTIKEDIIEHFKDIGCLCDVWIARNPAGYAFIEFESEELADRAIIEKQGSVLKGENIKLGPARDNDKKGEPVKIFVGNVAEATTKEMIEAAFSKCQGKIVEIWIATKPGGFAFVKYNNFADARKAADEVNGEVINGMKVRCDIARKSEKQSNKDSNPRSNYPPPLPYGLYPPPIYSSPVIPNMRDYYDTCDKYYRCVPSSYRSRSRSPPRRSPPRHRSRSRTPVPAPAYPVVPYYPHYTPHHSPTTHHHYPIPYYGPPPSAYYGPSSCIPYQSGDHSSQAKRH